MSASPACAPEPLTHRLRRETTAAHAQLEATLDLLADASRPRLLHVLARFWGFHRTWEPAAAALIADPPFFDPRRRLEALEHDLRLLGMADTEIAALPTCEPVLWLTDTDAAWGSLYVMEGSTLGGQVIARALHEAGMEGLRYFDGRGREAGPMWRETRGRLDGRGDEAGVAAGAEATFRTLTGWMS